jgi:hypothetical protein
MMRELESTRDPYQWMELEQGLSAGGGERLHLRSMRQGRTLSNAEVLDEAERYTGMTAPQIEAELMAERAMNDMAGGSYTAYATGGRNYMQQIQSQYAGSPMMTQNALAMGSAATNLMGQFGGMGMTTTFDKVMGNLQGMGITPQNQDMTLPQLQGIMSGNPLTMMRSIGGQMGNYLGLSREMIPLNYEQGTWGSPVYQDYMSQGDLSHFGIDPSSRIGNAAFAGGTNRGGLYGLNVLQQQLGFDNQAFGLNQQRQSFGLGEALRTGEGLGALLGPQFEGMGQRHFYEQERSLTNRSVDLNVQRQDQYRDLNYRQFMENWSANGERMQTQYQWQSGDMERQRSTSLMQRGWQREEWSFNEGTRDMQQGWQMEDFQENIRFATGRDRRLLMRQRDRSAIMYGRQVATDERGQSQQETLWSKEDERYEEEKRRLEQRKEWDEESQERQRRHYEERMGLDEDFFQLQLTIDEERRKLQDQQFELSQARGDLEAQWQQQGIDQASYMFEMNKQIWQLELEISKQQSDRLAEFRRFVDDSLPAMLAGFNDVAQAVAAITGASVPTISSSSSSSTSYNTTVMSTEDALKWLNTPPGGTASGGSGAGGAGNYPMWGGGPVPGYGAGGYTGYAAKHEPRGLVHGGEWVVPQQGALVVRGDNPEVVRLLSQILNALVSAVQSGRRANVVIQTSDASAPMVRGLLDMVQSEF